MLFVGHEGGSVILKFFGFFEFFIYFYFMFWAVNNIFKFFNLNVAWDRCLQNLLVYLHQIPGFVLANRPRSQRKRISFLIYFIVQKRVKHLIRVINCMGLLFFHFLLLIEVHQALPKIVFVSFVLGLRIIERFVS